jgi:hypothetical protein
MGMEVITGIGMEAQPIGVTVPDTPTVHEAVRPTGMTGPEVQPGGAEARRRGIMARVTLTDIAEDRRTGAAVPEVRPDGVAAPRLGAAGPARFMGPVVAPVRGGVEPKPALARESAPRSASIVRHRTGWGDRGYERLSGARLSD